MNVWVTGGTGFLGHAVVRRLEAEGQEVHYPSSAVYDLRYPENISAALDLIAPDAIVHLAAAVGGIASHAASPGRFLYENLAMGIELMEQARGAGVGKFVTVGTACSYPAGAPVPLREETIWDGYPAEPTAAYGLAKRMLLAQGQAYRTEYGMNVIHVIPSNLYGPGDTSDHVVAMMVRKFTEGSDTVTLWGDGSATRDFLYVEDAARGVCMALENYDSPDPVNLGTGVETSMEALAGMIADRYDYTGRIVWDTSRPKGTSRRVMDVSRAADEFGFTATTPLAVGLWNVSA